MVIVGVGLPEIDQESVLEEPLVMLAGDAEKELITGADEEDPPEAALKETTKAPIS